MRGPFIAVSRLSSSVITENATLKVQRSVVHGKTSVDDAAEIEKDDKSVFKR